MPKVPSRANGQARRPRVRGGRPHRVDLVLSDSEYETLRLRALAAGVSVPRFVAEMVLLSPGRSIPERRSETTRLAVVDRQLRGVATNLNQLAMKANASGHVIAGTDDTIAATQAALRAVRDAVERIQ